MADNTVLNLGSGGDTIGTEEIGGVKYQIVKVAHGGDGGYSLSESKTPLPVGLYPSDSALIDAFGRIRVSNQSTIFDSKQLHDKLPLFWDEVINNSSGSATSTHSTTNAAVTMHVEANDTIIRQTKMRFNYQPGKSQLYLFTGVLGTGVASTTKRIGCFDDNDGLFFELDGTTLNVGKRKGGSDTTVAQASWNIDTFDGNGPSGVTLDTSKVNIFFIDFEWLGVGRVRFGLVIDGIIYYCHQMVHANIETSVYNSTPNHPIRYEAISTGGTTDLVHICSTCISEGGMNPNGVIRAASTENVHVDANSVDVLYAVVGIRLKSTHLDATVLPTYFSMISETSDDFRWVIMMNPTINGSFTYTDISDSACQYAKGATANTLSASGTIIAEGYASTSTLSASESLESALRIGATVSGVPDELVLCVMPLSANADIQGSLSWRELL